MNVLGNHILVNVQKEHRKRIFFPYTEAQKIRRLENGLYEVVCSSNEGRVVFQTKHLVLACGGKQSIPPTLEKDYGVDPLSERFFNSDDVLKMKGFLAF